MKNQFKLSSLSKDLQDKIKQEVSASKKETANDVAEPKTDKGTIKKWKELVSIINDELKNDSSNNLKATLETLEYFAKDWRKSLVAKPDYRANKRGGNQYL